MSMNMSGIIKTDFDPTILRDYLEKAMAVELTDTLLGRNLVSKIMKFPNNAWSYVYRIRGYTRATVINEFSAPPIVAPKVRKLGLEYNEIGTAVGITDKMVRFADIPMIEQAIEAGIEAMRLKQDRDIINLMISSVAFYADGSTNIYLRLQNADHVRGEWKTFEIEDATTNRCAKGNSHVIVGDVENAKAGGDYPAPSGGENKPLLLKLMNRAMRLIEEHPQGKARVALINPMQVEDIRNFVDFTKDHTSNPPSIAPPQFNAIMREGWEGMWQGVNFLRTHEVTPGTMVFIDTDKMAQLAEYSAPFVEGGIRDQWRAWEGETWRQYYQPFSPNPDYISVAINLLGDLKADNSTVIDHTVKADVDAQYTALPEAGQERAGIPG